MILVTNNGHEFLVSEIDAIRIADKKLCFDTSNGYVKIKIDKDWILLHRYLIRAKTGEIVDHANRIKTDNRLENLRIVSKALNNINREIRGIYFDKWGNRWRACISHKNKTLKLGSFKTEKEALEVRAKKLKELHPDL